MIILLYGEDIFRSQQKEKEIIAKYQAKNKTGLNLTYFKEGQLDFEEFQKTAESASMFAEKKLIILENALEDDNFKENFFAYARRNKLKDSQDVIIVMHERKKIGVASYKTKVNMLEEFKFLNNLELARWIKEKVKKEKAKITPEAVNKLIVFVGNNLWQMNNELDKLINYAADRDFQIEAADIDLLVQTRTDLNIFKTLDALAQRDKKNAFNFLHKHLAEGAKTLYLFSMFIYQLRTLIIIKDLIEKGVPFYSLAKESGLHPFVIKKSWSVLQGFSLNQLKRIYQRLLEIEIDIKKGRLDETTALDLLIAEI